MASLLLANIIKNIHLLLVFAVLFGWMLPIRYIPFYILFVLVILFDWNDFDGMCILTKLEHWARYDNWQAKSPLEGGPEFIRPLLNKTFHLNLTTIQTERLNNFIFIFGLTLGFIRIAIHYQMFNSPF